MQNGIFVISLDFELMWGVWDSKSIESYGENIIKVHEIIPKLISTFETYEVSATFATVGFLFNKNKSMLLNNLPELRPKYKKEKFNPYLSFIDLIEEKQSQYYFAPELIKQVADSKLQELATHTYAHIYCLEEGMEEDAFEADLKMAVKVADLYNQPVKSLIFPRNQFNNKFLSICEKYGLTSYRGNEKSWIYAPKSGAEENPVRRAVRLMDTYLNLTGHHCYNPLNLKNHKGIVNIPSSRFFRPYSEKLSFLENLKIRRIKKSMTHAAKNGKVYHLWWHPHNFGYKTEEMFKQLEEILKHYKTLHEEFGFKSCSMNGVVKMIQHEK